MYRRKVGPLAEMLWLQERIKELSLYMYLNDASQQAAPCTCVVKKRPNEPTQYVQTIKFQLLYKHSCGLVQIYFIVQ